MDLYGLDLGSIHGSARIFDETASAEERVIFPVNAYLVLLDDGRSILFDTGVHPGGIRANTASYRYQAPEQTLENQLALFGKGVDDIDAVVLSHLHYDHAGYLFRFTNVPVYVNSREYRYAFEVHDGAYCLRDYDVGVSDWRFVDDDVELFPGVEAIQLPGHSPGHLGLLVHLASGDVLLPQDALYSLDNDAPKLVQPGIVHDVGAYRASVQKICTLRSGNFRLRVLYGHDAKQLRSLAPNCYR